jgi:hypothetical protein
METATNNVHDRNAPKAKSSAPRTAEVILISEISMTIFDVKLWENVGIYTPIGALTENTRLLSGDEAAARRAHARLSHVTLKKPPSPAGGDSLTMI